MEIFKAGRELLDATERVVGDHKEITDARERLEAALQAGSKFTYTEIKNLTRKEALDWLRLVYADKEALLVRDRQREEALRATVRRLQDEIDRYRGLGRVPDTVASNLVGEDDGR